MPKFKYVATDALGNSVKGAVKADSPEQAYAELTGKRLYDIAVVDGERKASSRRSAGPVAVTELPVSPAQGTPGSRPKKSFWQIELTSRKVPRQEIMNFSRQLASFIRAGIPILEAIDIFAQESGNKLFQSALVAIAEDLRRGETFSVAVGGHPYAFPRFYVDMLRAAELTGRLDSVLEQLARYIERDLEAKRKIRSATTYPALIGVMSVGTVAILALFVLPRFRTFFQSFNAKLPLPTRIVLTMGDFVTNYWWAILGGATVIFLVGFLVFHSPGGRMAWDRFVLRLPVISDVIRYAIIERFCRILSSMVKAGVPLPEAMVVVAESSRNKVYEQALNRVREQMMEGEGIANPITYSQMFPPAVLQMIRVGENTGTLDDQLETAAAYYAQELDYKIKRLTTLFEPAMIVFMGLVVGFVAIALVSAMYGIFRQVNIQ